MKKIILTSLIAGLVSVSAYAGGGYVIWENEYTTTTQNVTVTPVESKTVHTPARAVRPAKRYAPCGTSSVHCGTPRAQYAGNPVAVKTHSEVIEHYQVYQPVTVYQPAGNFATRTIVENCDRCM
ncbi:hypothetical protein LJC18_04120 [Lachnospiraceae bacterium OttesenSCG-928-E19]|nr:hypothetical protein [Lachnospiraceae bacterium OttesenSCG-928-E19]